MSGKESGERDRQREIAKELKARFGAGGEIRFFRAPGRVDLLGSHTDYNQGFILAVTVDRDLVAGVRLRRGAVNFYSLNTGEEVRLPGLTMKFNREHGWTNYPMGVIHELQARRIDFPGFDFVVHGNIPVGGNLSSSAALEAVTCVSALDAATAELPAWDQVKLCQKAENEFVGLPCGIMDQFAVIMGAAGQALRLDCRSLEFEPIPFAADQAVLAVIDSGLGRSLVASKYAERVQECLAAVKTLAKRDPRIKSLRDAGLDLIESARADLGDLLYRRARHVVSENQRVLAAASAMKQNDLAGLGRIMEEGYQSSRNDYENSIPELDVLHDLAAAASGVLGVRICGAGWGGCLLALVLKKAAADLGPALSEKYSARAGREPKIYIVTPTAGAGPIKTLL